MDTNHDHVDELSIEEIEAEAAEALPERAAMSTLNITSLDTAGAAIEAVGDGAPGAGESVGAPEPSDPAGAPEATAAAPLPSETAPAEHGPPASVPGAQHSAAGEHVPHATGGHAPTGEAAPGPDAGGDTADTAAAPEPPAGTGTPDTAAAPEPPAGTGTPDTAAAPEPPAGSDTPDTAAAPEPPAGTGT